MMYKEVINKRRVPVIAILLVLLALTLYIDKGMEYFIKGDTTFIYLNAILFIIAIILMIAEVGTCAISYKYSVIADKLIVNRTIFNRDKTLISIKLEDIIYVGYKREYGKFCNERKLGSFICNNLIQKSNICVFNSNGQTYYFEFEPSEKLINKVRKAIKKPQ